MAYDLFNMSTFMDQVFKRKRLLKPRFDRMDYQTGMYLLQDQYQENKPLGERRFISNEPMTIVETAHRILTRFPVRWTIAWDTIEQTDPEEEERYGMMERALYGFMEDIDHSLQERGEMIARKFQGYQALLRGRHVSKVHLTKEAGRDSCVVYVDYDARFVLPTWDDRELSTIICETPMTLYEVAQQYPGSFKVEQADPSMMVSKFEIWDKKKMGVLVTGPMPPSSIAFNASLVGGGGGVSGGWAIAPTEHGFFDANGEHSKKTVNRLPFVVLDVNGVGIKSKVPAIYNSWSRTSPSNLRKMIESSYSWRGTRTNIAEQGRGILAPVERHIPQHNEAVASMWQHFQIDTFGTFFLTNRSGAVPEGAEEAIGTGGIIPGERGDQMQRFGPQQLSPAGVAFMSIVAAEREKSTISGVLLAQDDSRSGYLQSRREQVALNNIEPFHTGMGQWASMVGQLIVDQIQVAGAVTGPIRLPYVDYRGGTRHFYEVEFDPKWLRERKTRVLVKGEIKPALPTDLMERAQIANMLVNNKRPLISRSTAQEQILEIPDAKRENDRIAEDIAELEPVILMGRLAEGLRRRGDEEAAKLLEDRQTLMLMMRVIEQAQVMGMLGTNNTNMNMMGLGDRGNNQPGRLSRPNQEVQPAEMRNEGREQGGRPESQAGQAGAGEY